MVKRRCRSKSRPRKRKTACRKRRVSTVKKRVSVNGRKCTVRVARSQLAHCRKKRRSRSGSRRRRTSKVRASSKTSQGRLAALYRRRNYRSLAQGLGYSTTNPVLGPMSFAQSVNLENAMKKGGYVNPNQAMIDRDRNWVDPQSMQLALIKK